MEFVENVQCRRAEPKPKPTKTKLVFLGPTTYDPTYMTVPSTMKMKNMISTYVDHNQLYKCLEFHYEGKLITGDDTPETLGMKGKPDCEHYTIQVTIH